MGSKSWDALVQLESQLQASTVFDGASIGLLDDLFHQNKFSGKVPFVCIEWRGDDETGSDDSTETRVVPQVVTCTAFDKAKSEKANRREKIENVMAYAKGIKDAYETDVTLGGNAIYDPISGVRASRVSDRLPSPYYGVETDILVVVREDKENR